MINGYKEGADLSLINVTYRYSRKNEETGKYNKDHIDIIYKDNKTGEKKLQVIYEPTYQFYKTKDDIILNYNKFFIEKDKVDLYEVKYHDLLKEIAEITGNSDFYYNARSSGNRTQLLELNSIPEIFSSDMNIEDHYRMRFDRLYTNNIPKLNKSFFDIEVDGINARSDFPEMGECPINAISYIDEKVDKIYIFLLRNIENPLIEKFEKSINSSLFKELKKFIMDNVGGVSNTKKYGLSNTIFEFRFFDEEINLINNLFNTMNTNRPDFTLAWNMAFDIPYIIERIKTLGYGPSDIIGDQEFDEGYASYYIDERHMNTYEARGDRYDISSFIVFLDQLIHFASRRKGQASFPNFKLDTAAEIITNGAVRKLNYSHITREISKLPYLDYKTFVFYNIMDTIAQKAIETETGDIDYIYNKCIYNNTRYEKGHRQTIYLTNRAVKEFYNDGFIIGNNVNRHNSRIPFVGAMVGDPRNNSNYSKKKQYGEYLNIIDNSDDYDFKSLYPSIDLENNMAPNTQIGKLIIPERIYDHENPFHGKFYERGGNFLDDLVCGNYIEFCKRWFNLPSYENMLIEIYNFYKENPCTTYLGNIRNGYIHPVSIGNSNMIPVSISDEEIKPVYFISKGIDIKEYIKNIY